MEYLEHRSSSSSRGSVMDVDSLFPVKPQSSRLGRPLSLFANCYKFKCNTGGRDVLFEYQVKTSPPLTCHTNEEKIKLSKIVKKLKPKLEGYFENHVYWESFLYSFEKIDDLSAIEEETIEEDGVSYLVSIDLHSDLTFDNPMVTRFFRAFTNQLIKKAKLRLTRGGKHFDPRDPLILEGVNMYRAYFNTMKTIGGQIYLNLNPSVKFFQQESILKEMQKLRDERRVREELTGRTVMTLYNNRVYKIDEIDFSKNPRHTFFCDMHNKNKEMSYADYIFENYKCKIGVEDQPMIKHHNIRTGQDIFLIPEFCVLTGITEQQKGKNFHSIKNDMFANAKTKDQQAKYFFETLKSDKELYSTFTNKWKIQIEEEPVKTKAYRCTPGTIIGNKKKTFNLDKMKRDFSHEFSGPFLGKTIKNWAIIYGSKSYKEHQTFFHQLKETVVKDFEYKCGKPLEIELRGDDRRAKSWIDTISGLMEDNQTLDVIICIAPGRKGNSPIYEDLKYYLQTKCPIPSQVILSETIKKNSRTLRNIVKNLMIQISAKMGDIPWAYKGLPLISVPTMIIGIDVCHRVGKNKKSILGFVASLDKYVGKYYSNSVAQGEKQEMAFGIEKLFQEAINEFIAGNGSAPQQIIVYRDAVSEGQSQVTLESEVPQLMKAIQNLKDIGKFTDDPSILFLLCNKRIEQRFFTEQRGAYQNPSRGLVIQDGLTRPDRFEFYMISHDGPTGLQCPVRYEVIVNTFKDLDPKDLYDLTNNLCYGFFNLQGAVRIPGPLMYAHTLCNQVSKICSKKSDIAETPKDFKNKLYYI
jgi:aubergine-like protein